MRGEPRPRERYEIAGPAEPLSARCSGKNKCTPSGEPPARVPPSPGGHRLPGANAEAVRCRGGGRVQVWGRSSPRHQQRWSPWHGDPHAPSTLAALFFFLIPPLLFFSHPMGSSKPQVKEGAAKRQAKLQCGVSPGWPYRL